MNQKFGIEKFALFNSAGFGEMILPIDGVKQILGSNNVGKTSTISCLKLFYSDSPAKESKEVWGGYDWEQTRKFYFHNGSGSGSWMAFSLRTERNGLVTVIFFNERHQNSISRMIVRRPFDRSLFVAADGSVAHNIAEIRARLSEQGVNEPDDIMMVNSAEDWRQVLVGNHPHKKAINLGIVPLASADNKTFAAFKKTLIRALTNAGFAASELKEAIENAASVSNHSFSFSDGTHYAALKSAQADTAEARVALAAKADFERFKNAVAAYEHVAGEHHAMAIASTTRLAQLEAEISLQLATMTERRAEHARLIDLKLEDVANANKLHMERGAHAYKLSHELQARREEHERLELRISESMESRTFAELGIVVADLQEAIGKAGALTPQAWDGLIQRKRQELARLHSAKALLEAGKISVEDWIGAECGVEALSAVRQAYSPEALLQPVDMLNKDLLIEVLGEKVAGVMAFGPLSIEFKEGQLGAYDKKPTLEEVQGGIAVIEAEIADLMLRRADVDRIEGMRAELARLAPLLADLKRVEEIRLARASEPAEQKAADDAVAAAQAADEARRAAEKELAILKEKNLDREARDMELALQEMRLERSRCGEARNTYEKLSIASRASSQVDEMAAMGFDVLRERFVEKDAAVQSSKKAVADALLIGVGATALPLAKLVRHLNLPTSADDFVGGGNEFLRAVSEAIEGAEDKIAASAMTIKTQIGTAAASLKQILDSLGDISKRVESMNREIQSVKLSNLSSISISMQKRDSDINEIRDFIELAKDGNDLLAMDVPESEKDRIRDAAMRAFESSKTFEASALYSLQFRVESVTGEVDLITDSGKTGSEGTRTMFQILSGVILTKSLLKPGFEHKYALNMLVDESLRLDGSNSKELIRFILRSGFTPILANPGIAVDLGVDYEVFLFQKSVKDNLSYVTASKPVLNVRQKILPSAAGAAAHSVTPEPQLAA